jgi:hypothetical protein
MGVQPVDLDGSEHTRPREEPAPRRRFERETGAAPWHDVERELRVLPQLVLIGTDVEGTAGDLAEEDVACADPELAAREAHRGATVATPPRLVKEERTVRRSELAHERRRLLRHQDACCVHDVVSQKKPIGFGS